MADFDAPSTRLNKSRAANTILLPDASIANGEENGLANLEYLEENEAEMQADPMEGGEFNALEASDDVVEPRRSRRGGANRNTPVKLESEEGVEEAPEDEGRSSETRTPTQVPKKRRDAAALAASAIVKSEPEDEDDVPIAKRQAAGKAAKSDGGSKAKTTAAKTPDPEQAEELPTSSARAATNKENTVDENQCRVCTSTDDLVSIFKKVEALTVAEMLMIICPTVTIARKDFMPQFICNTCLDNVTIAVQLKNQCENTEKELRKKLSRSKNKLRRPVGYVVIDAPLESDPPSEDEPQDDEFKVSDVEVSASAEDSDAEFIAVGKKKRASRAAAGGRGSRRKSGATPTQSKAPKSKKKTKSISSELDENPIGGDSTDEEQIELPTPPPPKKKKRKSEPGEEKPSEYPCDECEQKFTRKLSLVLHKKAHSGGREPINCEVCGKQFKIQGAYRSHLEKHKEDYASPHNCNKCDKSFVSKSDLRKHIADSHEDVNVFFTCEKCKRAFTSEQRLTRHQENRCPGYEVKQKPKNTELENFAVGKDLFKTVAPLTTTYWSDSFSD